MNRISICFVYGFGFLLVIFLLGCTNKQAAAVAPVGYDVARFDSLFTAWEQNYRTNPQTRMSSNTHDAKKLEQYSLLLAMGEDILPLVIEKLAVEENFFALTLYDDIQRDESLKSYASGGGEQGRARETVEKFRKRYADQSSGVKGADPVEQLKEFYTAYILLMSESDYVAADSLRSLYVTKELLYRIEHFAADDEDDFLGYDPIIQAQDSFPEMLDGLEVIRNSEDTYTVVTDYAWSEDGKKRITYQLVKEEGIYKINRIVSDPNFN